jgi:hypothetical protein
MVVAGIPAPLYIRAPPGVSDPETEYRTLVPDAGDQLSVMDLIPDVPVRLLGALVCTACALSLIRAKPVIISIAVRTTTSIFFTSTTTQHQFDPS